MEVKAQANFIKIAPRKTRLVVNLVRGLDVSEALLQLRFVQKAATMPVKKLLESAVANAEHNFELDKNNLFIKEIKVDEGPTAKRWRPRAFGRATPIMKRTSHISVILAEKVESLKNPEVKKAKEKALSEVSPKQVKSDIPAKQINVESAKAIDDPEESKEIFDVRSKGKRRNQQHEDKRSRKDKGFLKKIFNRKSGT